MTKISQSLENEQNTHETSKMTKIPPKSPNMLKNHLKLPKYPQIIKNDQSTDET